VRCLAQISSLSITVDSALDNLGKSHSPKSEVRISPPADLLNSDNKKSEIPGWVRSPFIFVFSAILFYPFWQIGALP